MKNVVELFSEVKTIDINALSKLNPLVKIGFLGDEFKELFLNEVVEKQGYAILNICTLKKVSLDSDILVTLGQRAETTLATLWGLLSIQPDGELGMLLNNGCANVSYMRGKNNALRAVRSHWYGGGWCIFARKIDGLSSWRAGRQIITQGELLL